MLRKIFINQIWKPLKWIARPQNILTFFYINTTKENISGKGSADSECTLGTSVVSFLMNKTTYIDLSEYTETLIIKKQLFYY